MAHRGIRQRHQKRRAIREGLVERGGLEVRRGPESRLVHVQDGVAGLVRHDVQALGRVHVPLRLLVDVVEELEALPVVEGVEVLSGAELHEERAALVPAREVALEEVLPDSNGPRQSHLPLPILERERAGIVGGRSVAPSLDRERGLARIRLDRGDGLQPDRSVGIVGVEADRGRLGVPLPGTSPGSLHAAHFLRLRKRASAWSTGSVFTTSSFVSQAFLAIPSP